MKKMLVLAVILAALILTPVARASASEGAPVGSCAPGFMMMQWMDPTGDMMHRHIGLKVDLNGDGYICMKVISPDKHLHVDNNLPLP